MGTWGIGSQWCNRLLVWINVIHWGRFFLWAKEKGGDEPRLAREIITGVRGQTLVFD
jgi:hypothetical protein